MTALTVQGWKAYNAQLETMDHAQLVREAKRWRFQCDLYTQKERAILQSTSALLTEDRRRLALIWALTDARKKTVSTQALLEIFTSNVMDDVPQIPAKPAEHVEEITRAAGLDTPPAPVVHLITPALDLACGHDGQDRSSSVAAEVTCRACQDAAGEVT